MKKGRRLARLGTCIYITIYLLTRGTITKVALLYEFPEKGE